MMLRFVNARNDKKKLNEIKKLYDEAFPKEEQIPFWILRKASRTSTADLMQVYDDDLLVGFIHLVYFEDVVYLYYLAIESARRATTARSTSRAWFTRVSTSTARLLMARCTG